MPDSRGGELHAITLCECAFGFAIERHALEPTCVVRDASSIIRADGDPIVFRVHVLHACVVACIQTNCLAALAVAHEVAWLVALGPLSVGARDVLARHQHAHAMLVAIDECVLLHRSVDHLVEILPRVIVR